MGLLDNMLGGGRAQGGGGISPMTLALLGVLAYRTYQGKGRLAGMLGRDAPGSTPAPGGGVGGQLGGGTGQLGGAGGGLGDILGDLFGGGGRGGATGGIPAGGLGEALRGGLGGMLGGAAGGGFLGAGLNELIQKMQQNGHGDAANSWVGTGQNRQLAPQELEDAVGRDTLQTLASETGRPYAEVLSELSQSLPQTVDQLTPNGRMPTEEDHRSWL